MSLSAKELNEQTTQVVKRLTAKVAWDNKKWFSWDKAELLRADYSERVVAKAKHLEWHQLSNNSMCATFVALMNTLALPTTRFLWILMAAGNLGQWIYYKRKSGTEKISYEDNSLILAELRKKLGSNFEKLERRPLLWRLDAFLSRKPTHA